MEGLSWKRLMRAASAGPLLQVRKLRMWPRGAAASERLPGCLSPHAGASSHLWAAALDLCPEVTSPPPPSCLPLRPLTLLSVLLPGCACKCSCVHCGSSISLTRQGACGPALFRHLCPAWTQPLDERTKLWKPWFGYVSFTSLPSVAQCKEQQCGQTLRASPGCCSSISMGVLSHLNGPSFTQAGTWQPGPAYCSLSNPVLCLVPSRCSPSTWNGWCKPPLIWSQCL